MKNIWIAFIGLFLYGCDPVDNYIDTGIVQTRHYCSVWKYLQTNSYDWDSVVVMIEHAGMIELFEGEEEITFWGPTNHSIRRYLLENYYTEVKDLSPLFCKMILEKHVVKGKYMKADVNFRIPDISGKVIGGTDLTTMSDNVLKAYREKEDYAGIAQAGPEILYLFSVTKDSPVPLASPDIECNNGVVHSLNYNYELGEI
ncbi:fasciclin domain-containing protein [Gabonibacter massiliensis]|uniref:fasciclin domain-containing protein n=1 Tax=Gabonibacter massiliensis TaxID=1720195 RepID=UPI00073E1F91|nr:fasciclin domain-containing protein [Gabonibacter massiliensis]